MKKPPQRKQDQLLQVRVDFGTVDKLNAIQRHGSGPVKSKAELVRELIDKEWRALHPQKRKGS